MSDAAIRRMAHEIVLEWISASEGVQNAERLEAHEVAEWSVACARKLAELTPNAELESAFVPGRIDVQHRDAPDCNCIACAIERGRDDS